MEVVAVKKNNDYLCEISHYELEKFLALGYGNLDRLKEGSVVDMASGVNFADKAIDAMKKTEAFISSNKEVIESIITGISLFKKTEEQEKEAPEEITKIVKYLTDEKFPSEHLKALLSIACLFNESKESEADVFAFAEKLREDHS